MCTIDILRELVQPGVLHGVSLILFYHYEFLNNMYLPDVPLGL